jgi:Rod binding domain-containing protein
MDTAFSPVDLGSITTAAQPQPLPLAGAGASPDGRKAAAHKAAQDFEAFFASQMIESMSAGIKSNAMFGGGQGEQIYRSMLNQEYGKTLAKHGGLGIAPAVEREMLRMQEAHDNAH